MEELKPCPFCGGNRINVIAIIDEEHGVDCQLSELYQYGGKCNNFSVNCQACYGNSGYRRTPEEAVTAWNHRAID